MVSDLYETMKSIPGGVIMLTVLVGILILAVLFIKYNVVVLKALGKFNTWITGKITGKIGSKVKAVNKKFKRTADLYVNSPANAIYRYFDSILVNTGLHRSGVTVAGLLFFLFIMSVICTAACTVVFSLEWLSIPALGVFFILFVILFRYVSLTRVEQNEAHIMDAIDLLVSDVKSGIFNSIIRYQNSFHESIRPYFLECIDDVQNKGYSFTTAMESLTDKLGYSFSDFAQKAIYYESKREEGSEGIFGAIIELNRQRRILRRENAIAFKTIKTSLIVSSLMIFAFAMYTGLTDPFISNFLSNTILGRIMILVDVLLVAFVINYLAGIRAKTL